MRKAIDEAQEILANSYETAKQIADSKEFYPGGSVWVWDGTDPAEGGSWHAFGTHWPVDPNCVLYLDPVKVDRARVEAEILLNAFPATERRLDDLGCSHVELVHKPITTVEDALRWSVSVYNVATPVPTPWHGFYTDELGPGVRDWPYHVVATAQLVRDGFCAVQVTKQGRIGILPVDEGCSAIFWAEPGTIYDEEVRKAAAKGLDRVMGPEHPISTAAYNGQWRTDS